MTTQSFKTIINANREKIWNILWGKESYLEWTSGFDVSVSSEWIDNYQHF